MFRFILARGGLLLTAGAALLLSAVSAPAQQQGWPLNPGFNGFSENRSASVSAYTEAAPTFVAPSMAAPAAGQTQIRSFYPSNAGEEYGALSTLPAGNRPTWINVVVPANAEILFGNFKTSQQGTQRAFVSPPLTPGQDYSYDITARWQEGGREVVRTRHITVHAGDVLSLSF
jgi:uncharacterized protein (TIGR03000 family)